MSYFEKGEKSDVSLSEVTQEFAKSVKSNEAYLRLSTKYLIQLWSENKNRPDSNVIPKISRQYFPAQHIDEAISRQHTPKIAFVTKAKTYTTSSGKNVNANEIDLHVRALSMGKLHHAMMGTAAVAIGAAAAVERVERADLSDGVCRPAADASDRNRQRLSRPAGRT